MKKDTQPDVSLPKLLDLQATGAAMEQLTKLTLVARDLMGRIAEGETAVSNSRAELNAIRGQFKSLQPTIKQVMAVLES